MAAQSLNASEPGAPSPAGLNPFAEAAEPGRHLPLPAACRPSHKRALWARLRGWLGWPSAAGEGRRIFATSDQLELVLGRPQLPLRKPSLETGSPTRIRGSHSAAKSKVIYESKPAAATDAARMMEESDRAYLRLRGRRLESLRLPND